MSEGSASLRYLAHLKESGSIKSRIREAERMEEMIAQKLVEVDALREALQRHVRAAHAAVGDLWTVDEINAAKADAAKEGK